MNLGGEQTKSGLAPEALGPFLDAVRALPSLRLEGLMALPPPTEDLEQARGYFQRLRELARAHGLTGLSMGTTHDFELAIARDIVRDHGGTLAVQSRADLGTTFTLWLPEPEAAA